jgi:hypothetical protein
MPTVGRHDQITHAKFATSKETERVSQTLGMNGRVADTCFRALSEYRETIGPVKRKAFSLFGHIEGSTGVVSVEPLVGVTHPEIGL